jgi:hypothetical protein
MVRKMNTTDRGRWTVKKSFRDLKIYGRFYWHVVQRVDGGGVAEVHHLPFNMVRAGEKNEMGNVETWYVSNDWQQFQKKENEPKPYPSWRQGIPSGILAVDLFPSDDYYPNPDYIGGVYWIAVDMEVGHFHLSNIENSFQGGYHIHHSNGIPSAEQREELRRTYERELSGPANSGGIILTWSEGQDRATELTPLGTSDLDKQFQFVSEEATKKIMIAHRVVTPALFGIREGAGLGNNAEELETGMELLTENVLKGYRQAMTWALEYVYDAPFMISTGAEVDGETQDTATLEAQAALKGSVGGVGGVISILQTVGTGQMSPSSAVVVLQELYGFDKDTAERTIYGEGGAGVELSGCGCPTHLSEDKPVLPEGVDVDLCQHFASVGEPEAAILEDYRLIDEEDVTDLHGDLEYSKWYGFTIEGKPAEPSSGDVGFYKIRYAYVAAGGQPDIIDTTRDFCRTMMTDHKDTVFRKEDIDIMSFTRANPEFGSYSIWRYKGSYNCRHRWVRRVYALQRVPAGQSVTINGKTYKGGQYLPAGDFRNYRVTKGTGIPAGVALPYSDNQAIRRNPKVKK